MDFSYDRINSELLSFLDHSPVPCFAVRNMEEILGSHGFTGLCEGKPWKLTPSGAYYVSRNDTSLIAFRIPEEPFTGFQIMASHCDSPVFKIKPNAEISVNDRYIKLNTEKYGGALFAPWLDRPLSVAGRVMLRTDAGIVTRLINIDRDLCIIPNLAIHMNREVNNGYTYNAQTDLLPLFCEAGTDKTPFLSLLAQELRTDAEAILDADLFLYNRMKATLLGKDREFIASGRLDDLQCAFASLQGILYAQPSGSVAVHCVFDNEEVGSSSLQGAAGSFLADTLHRISAACGRSGEQYLQALSSSFMVSADNAHSLHPNHTDKADPTNRPYMNGGIVIKYSADQKYTTDAVSGALFRILCRKAGVPWQTFANRSDMIGGSTLGTKSLPQVSVRSVDIGLAQLSMHSPYETAGARDTAFLVRAAEALFSSSLRCGEDGSYTFI